MVAVLSDRGIGKIEKVGSHRYIKRVSVGAYKKLSEINAFHHIDRKRPHNQGG